MQHSNSSAANAGIPRNSGLTLRIAVSIGATVLLLLASSTTTNAQAAPTANAAQIEALQKKLDALQSQMAEVQSELRQMSGTGAS